MAAFMMTSLPSNNVHASVGLGANHMPAAMMAAKASHNVLPAVCCLRAARGADRHYSNDC